MKHLMLSTAVAAVAFIASPALAQEDSGVKLGLGGMYKGYVSYVDMDEDLADIHAMDILHETEVHFKGETTLDNGLTVGAKVEAEADGGVDFARGECDDGGVGGGGFAVGLGAVVVAWSAVIRRVGDEGSDGEICEGGAGFERGCGDAEEEGSGG